MGKLPLLDHRATIAVGYSVYDGDIPDRSALQWFKAVISSLVVLRAFDRGGSCAANQCMGKIQSGRGSLESMPFELVMLKARRDAAVLRVLARFLYGMRACFAESFSICAGLRCLGFDSYVVVGYARIELFAPTQMHAWVEYKGEPVSDNLEVKYRYLEIQRYF